MANFQKFTFLTLFVAFVFNILNVQVRFSAQFKQASIQNFLFLNKLSGCLIGHLQYMNYLLLNEFYKYLIVCSFCKNSLKKENIEVGTFRSFTE